MCICICVYISIHICIDGYIYIYTHIHTYICICVYIYVYKQGWHFALFFFMGAEVMGIGVLSNCEYALWLVFLWPVNGSILSLNLENVGDPSNPTEGKLYWRCCAIQLSHVIPFNPHINSARGRNIVKDRMHWTIKEMILLWQFAMGKMLINEEGLKEMEGGLRFYAGR